MSCFSEQVPVTVEPLAAPTAGYDYLQGGAQLTFLDVSVGATSWFWDFGDGNTSTDQNPAHFYLEDGDYEVVLTVSNGNCESTYTETITILNSGVADIDGLTAFNLYPTIGNGQFMLTISLDRAADLNVSVVNVLGQEVYQLFRSQTASLQEEVNLPELASGTYFVQLHINGQGAVKKYVLVR
ncbi:MAG: T9SS type A sorting domain-containing protein [Saprospirales bacterium]|nr:T9SS type A sorting domain-containing protein [Saprospirales bacterium]